jgi:GT2 family glycosyltransferase
MIVGSEVMSVEHSVWIGMLDVDSGCPVVGVNGPLLPTHRVARLLIRKHLAPIGYVQVPAVPIESLPRRARVAAEASLTEALQAHRHCGQPALQPGGATAAAGAGCFPHLSASAGPGVSVVVCTRDRAGELETCLSAMRRIAYEPLEILVVDNAPTSDATRELVAVLANDDPRIRYTTEPTPGLSVARNHGLAKARHDLVAFTDDDTSADPHWPAVLAGAFAADPSVVCVTGLIASTSLTTSSERYFEARYASQSPFEPRRFDLSSRPTKLYPFAAGVFGRGANFALRRSGVSTVGGFDPLLGAGSPGRGGEDLDMFLRVILAGGRIDYVPSALVWHRHRPDATALSEQLYAYGHGLGAYVAKHQHSRDLQVALLSHGIKHAWSLIRLMRVASRESQLGSRGSRLAVNELRGMLAGAVRYWLCRAKPYHRSSAPP